MTTSLCQPGIPVNSQDPFTISEICRAQKISCKEMVSRAYHDSLFMAKICPTTMIFIPCFKGYSHRPDEHSSPEQIQTGVQVLAAFLAVAAQL
jgi:N-carbamoyl-L-amino-acid hydrolase